MGDNQDLALKIEEATVKVLREKDICAYYKYDKSSAIKSKSIKNFIVYLTELNEELWLCPFPDCYIQVMASGWHLHAVKHEIYRKTSLLNQLLNKYNLKKINQLEPIAVNHQKKWSKTGLDIFPPTLICHICFKKSKDKTLHKMHLKAHKIDAMRKVTCKFNCGKKLKARNDMYRHEKECDLNPNKVERKKTSCPYCHNLFFSFKSHLGARGNQTCRAAAATAKEADF
ncbi:hypothetical protein PVAND_005101 [Polypedilum vanderplanki]|uniref:Uncharacterized protein n=1 Tax=Polypedilum vanderplanki TaxID=319348 RepID=A0A9J6BZT2_POLVA|nr:hypothetical protein PVAND_005101 [Polypedilum vanderplanki]